MRSRESNFHPSMRTTRLVRVRIALTLFVLCLVGSGLTAIPLETELGWLDGLCNWSIGGAALPSSVTYWVRRVHEGVAQTNAKYPFVSYGTDWLAFAHVIIAVAFIGPLRDPVKNIWVIEWGIIACVLVIPFALLMGGARGIPWAWRLIDCAFGVFGILPLLLCWKWIREVRPAA